MTYRRTDQTVTTVRFCLPTRTTGVELTKAVSAAAKDYVTRHGIEWDMIPDDALTVTVEDDLIVISYPIEQP